MEATTRFFAAVFLKAKDSHLFSSLLTSLYVVLERYNLQKKFTLVILPHFICHTVSVVWHQEIEKLWILGQIMARKAKHFKNSLGI